VKAGGSKRGSTQSSTGASSTLARAVHRQGAFHVPTIVAGVTVLEMALDDGVLTPTQIAKAMIVEVKIKGALRQDGYGVGPTDRAHVSSAHG
jgi:hypothetical protein